MKNMKYTPGPWRPHKPEGSNGWYDICLDVNGIPAGRIATVYSGEVPDNARLIAAAPEMLDALIAQYRGVCRVCAEGCSCDGTCAGKEALQTVIEKATGMKIAEVIK